MTDYVNRKDKQLVCFLSVFAAYINAELEDPKSTLQRYRKKMRTILTYTRRSVDDILAGIDPAQVQMIANQCKRQALVVTYDTDPRLKTGKDLHIVSTSALQAIANAGITECLFCPKEGKDARECPLRAALLEAGVYVEPGTPRTVCPFRRS